MLYIMSAPSHLPALFALWTVEWGRQTRPEDALCPRPPRPRQALRQDPHCCGARVGALSDSSLLGRVGLLPQTNCASAEYLVRHGTPRCLGDLARHTLIH